MAGVYVDRSYRTMLGTAFYDRLTIVYGPRNVGKSELARYFLSRRYRGGPSGLGGLSEGQGGSAGGENGGRQGSH